MTGGAGAGLGGARAAVIIRVLRLTVLAVTGLTGSALVLTGDDVTAGVRALILLFIVFTLITVSIDVFIDTLHSRFATFLQRRFLLFSFLFLR